MRLVHASIATFVLCAGAALSVAPLPAASAAAARSSAAASSADADAFVGARRALHDAVSHGTPDDLLRARAGLAALAAADPGTARLRYWVALADWRVVPRIMDKDRAHAERYCKDGLENLERVLQLDPKDAEALALKASLQGISLSFSPGDMMTLGAEMEAEMGRAVSLAPGNPRVLFLQALNTLNKPAFVGGGPEKALEQFRNAQAAFEAEPADTTAAAWGRDDACLWAGRAAMKLEDYSAAVRFYRKALAANPEYAWVKYALLPEAEKALAAAHKAPASTDSAAAAAGRPPSVAVPASAVPESLRTPAAADSLQTR